MPRSRRGCLQDVACLLTMSAANFVPFGENSQPNIVRDISCPSEYEENGPKSGSIDVSRSANKRSNAFGCIPRSIEGPSPHPCRPSFFGSAIPPWIHTHIRLHHISGSTNAQTSKVFGGIKVWGVVNGWFSRSGRLTTLFPFHHGPCACLLFDTSNHRLEEGAGKFSPFAMFSLFTRSRLLSSKANQSQDFPAFT